MSDLVDVPEIAAERIGGWLYADARAEPVLVAMTAVRLAELPGREQLLELLAVAQQGGHEWVLLDGPRPSRPEWVLDPWWSERPQMTEALIDIAKARCVSASDLLAWLQA